MVFVLILLGRLIWVIHKSFWCASEILITETKSIIDVNGSITLHIHFTFKDRIIHNDTLTIQEEFSDLKSTNKTVKKWQSKNRIEAGESVILYHDPQNPHRNSLYKSFSRKDTQQVLLWMSTICISLLVAFVMSKIS